MAAATVESEFTVVNIIGAVAVATSLTDARLHFERLPVASLAGNVRVCAIQREICLPVVIETPLQPVNRVVA